MKLSVVIPTWCPRPDYLDQVIQALRVQTLCPQQWELVIVDNNSCPPITADVCSKIPDITAQIVHEPRAGLTWARLRGVRASKGDLIVFVDDDNVLTPDFLETSCHLMQSYPQVGVAGGKIQPLFEQQPEEWISEFLSYYAVRDLGEKPILDDGGFKDGVLAYSPECAPVGAGMVLTRKAAEKYAARVACDGQVVSDRTESSLSSAGDCDIVLTVLEHGWQTAYFPQLILTHLIPEARCSKAYLASVAYSISRSWVQVLALHGIRPWRAVSKPSVPFRKLRTFLRERAWKDSACYVRWRASCGIFDECSRL